MGVLSPLLQYKVGTARFPLTGPSYESSEYQSCHSTMFGVRDARFLKSFGWEFLCAAYSKLLPSHTLSELCVGDEGFCAASKPQR